jgi:hypothetical protein
VGKCCADRGGHSFDLVNDYLLARGENEAEWRVKRDFLLTHLSSRRQIPTFKLAQMFGLSVRKTRETIKLATMLPEHLNAKVNQQSLAQ